MKSADVQTTSERDENESEETKKCLLRNRNGQICKKIVPGKSEKSKKAWYKHLYFVHLKHEFNSEVVLYETVENGTVLCKACDFISSGNGDTTMGKHIIEEHGDEIFENLYAKECQREETIDNTEPTEGYKALSLHPSEMETADDNSSITQTESERRIIGTIPNSEDQQPVIVPKTENNQLDFSSINVSLSSAKKMCTSTSILHDATSNGSTRANNLFPPQMTNNLGGVLNGPAYRSQEIGDDDDIVEIIPEIEEKPTTKIWIFIDAHDAWRDFEISKPFSHITLRDVKDYLYQQRYFHKIKGQKHEFSVKYKLDDRNYAFKKIEHDNYVLPNIKGEIRLECW